MSAVAAPSISEIDQKVYKKRIWAWTMYDWANSAFATTILAAVLPVYFSQVAGSTLPSATIATSYWSIGLSVSLFLIAIISPILGTISDIARGKKRFLAVFAGIGIISTALLVLVGTGDWVLASVLGIIGRIGFNGANTFYDALLPHVAHKEDQDSVSARGYAMGYLGGGLLLAVNIVMIQLLPGTWGPRLSFFSVAIWWAIFSIPLFRHVPEPRAATAILKQGETVVGASFKRLRETIGDIQHYKELFKYLISFLIYNDGIGTIIGVAAIYGAELGFGAVELVLALLLVQFVGIPYSLIFGRLPSAGEKRRPLFLAFVLFNMVALPLVGSLGARILPANLSGARPAPYLATANAVGEGNYSATAEAIQYHGAWQTASIPGKQIGSAEDVPMMTAAEAQSGYELSFNGQSVLIAYSLGPDQGIWAVLLDGQPVLDPDTQKPLLIDAYNPTPRYDANDTLKATAPGQHLLQVVNTDQRNPASQGNLMTVLSLTVLPPARQSNLGLVLGMILGLEVVLVRAGFPDRAAVYPGGAAVRYQAQHPAGPMRLRDRRHLGVFPGQRGRVLVPGLDGRHRPGRQPGAQPQPVCRLIPGSQERRVLRTVWDHGKILRHYRPAALRRGGDYLRQQPAGRIELDLALLLRRLSVAESECRRGQACRTN